MKKIYFFILITVIVRCYEFSKKDFIWVNIITIIFEKLTKK